MTRLLTHNSARLLASQVLPARAEHNDDLVALLGTGHEANNLDAVTAWIEARFTDVDLDGLAPSIAGTVFDTLHQHLEQQFLAVVTRCAGPLPEEHPFLPAQILSARDTHCLAAAIYRLLRLGERERPLNGALALLLGEGHPQAQLTAWVTGQVQTYTHLPSELTLPLAQRLLNQLDEALAPIDL